MALKWFKVIEFGGLAPGPFCGMMLADHGAKVIRIDKPTSRQDRLGRGKRSIIIDMKKDEGRNIAFNLCKSADVVVEPFRPGVMEKLGLGPNELFKVNPKLVYARLTGFGQSGYLSPRAGHDINYIALSGLLSQFGRHKEKPHWPINILADFAGGGLMCAMGITLALLERSHSGKGQVVDNAMVEGAAYIGSWLWSSRDNIIWKTRNSEKGNRVLDGGAHFYEVYKTKDDKYMSVGAIEPQFYSALLKGLGLQEDEMPQYDFDEWPKYKEKIGAVFDTKTQDEWCQLFDHVDACVAPVLSLDEAAQHDHNKTRKVFLTNAEGYPEPAPMPQMSRTPGCQTLQPHPVNGQHTVEILREVKYSEDKIQELTEQGVVTQNLESSKL